MSEEDEGKQKVVPLRRSGGRKCPICGKAAVERYRPFCSRRCADLDLGRWLSGAYRVPTEEPAGQGEPPADDDT